MFKKRAGVFYRFFVSRVHDNYAFVNVANKYTRKTPHTNE